jgi:CubicO group peptidase (beta-lactamase class C family)
LHETHHSENCTTLDRSFGLVGPRNLDTVYLRVRLWKTRSGLHAASKALDRVQTDCMRAQEMKLNRLFLVALVSIVFLSPLQAQLSPQTAVVVTSIAGIDELDKYIEQARQDWQVPGLAVAIVKDDKVILSKGYGVKRINSADSVDRHTLFAIASNSKAFTSAALAILVDQGKLKWDDRVRQHLPWFQMNDEYAAAEMRVRDLLCHRSGMGTFSGDLLWYGTSYSPQEILIRSRHLKPEGPFRAHYGYSNLMFLAAGEVIQAVSGQPWPVFVQQHITAPLEMNRTIMSVRDLVAKDNFATPHKTYLDRSEPIAWVNWDSMAAAGGIISSVDDMSSWMRLQLRKGSLSGDKRIFCDEASRQMWESHTPIQISARASARFPTTHFRAYGLGWALADYHGRKTVGHGGGYDGMYSHVMLVPEENLGVVVLTNSMTGITDSIAYRVVDQFLAVPPRDWSKENLETFKKSRQAFQAKIEEATKSVAPDSKPSHPLEDFVGDFRCPLYGDVSVRLESGSLVMRLLPNPMMVADLTHLHYDTFVIHWRNKSAWYEEGTAHFVANARGKFTELNLDVPNDDLWFHEFNLVRIPESQKTK